MGKITIHFLGTGTAFNIDGRNNQCLMISTQETTFLIDAGATALQNLMESKKDLIAIDKIFFTHFHGDHTGGYPFIILAMSNYFKRKTPLTIYGPAGIKNLLNNMYDIHFAGTVPQFPIHFVEFPIERQKNYSIDEHITCDIVPMKHKPESLGYAFYLSERKIALTGDTGFIDDIFHLSANCDLFLPECNNLDKIEETHLSLHQIEENLHNFHCKKIAPIHSTNEVYEAIKAKNIPQLIPLHDGDVLEIP